uniref:Uncharacterized protein n=1 Tax=Anguilla anguilla TaxID=7936 RepID=A0A0E9SKC4_ANGAN
MHFMNVNILDLSLCYNLNLITQAFSWNETLIILLLLIVLKSFLFSRTEQQRNTLKRKFQFG